jgi:hypothetical protein
MLSVMRCWGLAACSLLSVSVAAAQPVDVVAASGAEDADSAQPQLGTGALPGGLHVPGAETLPQGTFAFAALGGFGYRSGLLGSDHRFGRGIGDLAFAYAPTPTLVFALELDGRYDRHYGLAPSGDDGYVGDPRLLARLAKPFGKAHVGAQVGVWVPGKDAPSVAGSAISVDARVVATLAAGPGKLDLEAGFRLDNSAKSVADPTKLSLQDRVSLGVSDFNAAVAGAHFAVPAGQKAFLGFEVSSDIFVGTGAPGPIIRGGAEVGFKVTPTWAVLAYLEGSKVPAIPDADLMQNQVTLVPYEPLITGGVGLQGRFGGGRSDSKGFVKRNERPEDISQPEYAEVSGDVTDEAGKPIVGANVTVKLKNNTGTAASDDKGHYVINKLPIGKTVGGKTTLDDATAEITITVEKKKPSTQTITLTKGANAIPKIALEPQLPPGELRAVLRAAGTGKPLANATVKIEPGGQTATSDADGNITLALPPGQYKATASAPGFKEQTLDVVVPEGGVITKNFELRK